MMQTSDRPSRFAAMPGDMKIPPAHLYPSRPLPSTWRVVVAVDQATFVWQSYATTSIDATKLAVSWVHDLLLENESLHDDQEIRVLEVLQVGT